jgi:hypothetical protein
MLDLLYHVGYFGIATYEKGNQMATNFHTHSNREQDVMTLRAIAVVSWGFPLCGLALLAVSYYSHTFFDVFVGATVTLFGTIGATLVSVYVHNAIADEREHERRVHPSYPYRNR